MKDEEKTQKPKDGEKPDPGVRLRSRILREVLKTRRFESSRDLKDALEQRCRQLHIPCEPIDLDDALNLVGSNHPLVYLSGLPRVSAALPRDEKPPVTRQEAARILRALAVRVKGFSTPAPQLEVDGAPEFFPRHLIEVRE